MKLSKQVICYLTLLLILLSVYNFQSVYAQQKETVRTVGSSASFTIPQSTVFGTSAAVSDLLDILVPIWLGDVAVIAPGISVLYVENSGTQLGLLLSPRFYLRMSRVAPYIGGRVKAIITIPDAGTNTYDWVVGLVFGGEYFVNPKFSFGVETRLNGFIPDPDVGNFILNTGASILATVYF
jgi:hypothetical protein